MRVWWLAASLWGCGRVGFDPATDPAMGSADAAADCAQACVSLSPADDFAAGPPPCGAWGSTTTDGFQLDRNGTLQVSPTAYTGSTDFGGCTLDPADFTRGAFVEVTSILTGAESYTNIDVYVQSGRFGMEIDEVNGTPMLGTVPGDKNQRPYDPVAMRFWRLVPDGAGISAQYSADARCWTALGRQSFGSADFTGANVTFGAGRYGMSGSGIATFARFNLCP